MKLGDKLYVVTRRDLDPGYQAVQSCHAVRQFSAEHSEIDKRWYTFSNYLALLSTDNLESLLQLTQQALDAGIKVSAFHEPDKGGEITAIVLEPSLLARELCKHLPLALKEV